MPYILDKKTNRKVPIDPMTGQPYPTSDQETMVDPTAKDGAKKKEPGLLEKIARAVVKPAVDYGNLVGGAGYEVYRAGKTALGDKNAYWDSVNRKNVENPFLKEEELKTLSDPKTAPLEGAKRAAGMMSYFIPAGKLAQGAGVGAKIVQGAAVGAKSGGLYGFSQSEGENVEDLAVDTVKGAAVGGAAGGVLGAAGGAISKMKGAKGNTSAKIINPEVPASPNMVVKKQEIVDELTGMGIKGNNAEEIATNVGIKYKDLSGQAEEILSASTKSKSLGRLDKVLRKQLDDNGEYFIPDDPQYTKLLDRELVLLAKKAENGKLSAKALFEFKNELASKLNNGFRKEAGDLSSPITNIEGVRLDLWRSIDDQITGIEPTVKEITKQMSFLHKASPGLKKSMEQLKEARPLGIPTGINLNKPLQNLQSKVSGVTSAVGSIPGAIPGGVKNATIKGATMMGINGQAEGEAPTEPLSIYEPGQKSIATPSDADSALEVTYVSPDKQWQTKSDGKSYSMDGKFVFDEQADDWVENPNVDAGTDDETNPDAPMSRSQYNAQMAALAQKNDTASVRQYGLLTKERNHYYPEQKLSANAQKRIGVLNQAEGIYTMVENLALGAGAGPGAWLKSKIGKLPGVEGGSEEDLERVNLALAKGIAGALASEVGVATDRDIERWLGLMPKVTDTMAERKRTLLRLQGEIMRSRQQIEAQKEDPSAISSSVQDFVFPTEGE